VLSHLLKNSASSAAKHPPLQPSSAMPATNSPQLHQMQPHLPRQHDASWLASAQQDPACGFVKGVCLELLLEQGERRKWGGQNRAPAALTSTSGQLLPSITSSASAAPTPIARLVVGLSCMLQRLRHNSCEQVSPCEHKESVNTRNIE
jgi:hypothetical protein